MQHRRRQHVYQAAKKNFQSNSSHHKSNQEEPSGIRFSER